MPIERTTGSQSASTNNTTTPAQTYTVRSGDTLGGIASRMGVTVEQLQNANKGRYPNITDPRKLGAGWQLQVPTGGRVPTDGASTPTTPAAQGWAPRSNDRVLFVAMNDSNDHRSTLESDALKARGTDVSVIKNDQRNPDRITTSDGRTHDLKTKEGAMSFALTLGLPAEQTQKIADVLSQDNWALDQGRDELAQIAREWAKAERGGQVPSRLVLSGHQTGSGVYGENNGKLPWEVLGQLAEAMPRGARSVEDFLVAGCYSGGQASMEKYQAMFPNVKTIMAYEGSSPGASSGATAHQKEWERATRGESQGINKDRFANMRKGENVSIWTRDGGLQGAPPPALSDLRSTMESGRAAYDEAFSGRATIADAQTGPVRDFYSATQRLLQHPDLPAAEKAQLTLQKDQTIRLLFYPVVSKRFQETHGQKIGEAYRAVGLTPPNFQTMSRADALASVKAFEDKLAANPNPTAQRQLQLLKDFSQLKPNVIPDTWV